MPTDRPDAAELVSAVREHLNEKLAPSLEGQPAFHLRVAINALAIVERTMAEGESMDQRELDRLREILSETDGTQGDLLELNHQLSERIRAGEIDDPGALLAHLRETVSDKLDLANPRYKLSREE